MSDLRDEAAVGYALIAASKAAYPRRGQPIVPRRLASLIADGALPAAATDAALAARLSPVARRKLANRVIRWLLERIERVQRKHRREDLRPAPASLAPARFADADYLAKTVELIVPELPLSDQAIRERLERAGIDAGRVDLVRLAKAATRLSIERGNPGRAPIPSESPYVVIALGAGKLVLRRRDVPLATGAYTLAVRTTLNWGVATVAGVTSQLSSQLLRATAEAPTADFVARVLATARGFEWLDQDSGWFWFRARPSRMMDALHKIFSVVTALSLPRLYWALFKGHGEPLRPPATALRSVVLALPGARIENDSVIVPHRLDRSTYLSAEERTLVEILEGRETALAPHALRAAAADRSLSSRAILAFLRGSPVVEVLPDGRCCLIGAPVGDAGRLAFG